jgi:hypothetical protein
VSMRESQAVLVLARVRDGDDLVVAAVLRAVRKRYAVDAGNARLELELHRDLLRADVPDMSAAAS